MTDLTGWVKELCSLDLPLSHNQTIRSLKVARHFTQEHQSVVFYLLPIGETSEDIVRDPNEMIVSHQASMKAKNLNKLLPAMTIRSRKYYRFEVYLLPSFCAHQALKYEIVQDHI